MFNKILVRILFFLTVILIMNCKVSKEPRLIKKYHEVNFTASSIDLIKFNIEKIENLPYVEELIDEKGRTKQLKFYNFKGELDYPGSGFFGGPIIRYDYLDNKIIETFFNSENEIANDFKFSEVPYRHIYYLNDKNEIVNSEVVYKIDFNLSKKSLKGTIEHLKLYEDILDEENNMTLENIFGYGYAEGKLNGIMPRISR